MQKLKKKKGERLIIYAKKQGWKCDQIRSRQCSFVQGCKHIWRPCMFYLGKQSSWKMCIRGIKRAFFSSSSLSYHCESMILCCIKWQKFQPNLRAAQFMELLWCNSFAEERRHSWVCVISCTIKYLMVLLFITWLQCSDEIRGPFPKSLQPKEVKGQVKVYKELEK